MAQRAINLRKAQGGESEQELSSAKQVNQSKRSSKTEQRLNSVFDALTEQLLTTLEHNYDRKDR